VRLPDSTSSVVWPLRIAIVLHSVCVSYGEGSATGLLRLGALVVAAVGVTMTTSHLVSRWK